MLWAHSTRTYNERGCKSNNNVVPIDAVAQVAVLGDANTQSLENRRIASAQSAVFPILSDTQVQYTNDADGMQQKL
jgi:hypothetical protein